MDSLWTAESEGVELLLVSKIFNLCDPDPSTLAVVLVVQWLGVGLVIERWLVRLPAGELSSNLGRLGQLSLSSLRGR